MTGEPATITDKPWRYTICTSKRRQSSIKSNILASIDGVPLFGHESSPNEPILAFLAGYSQKNKSAGFFVTFLSLPSSSRFRHDTDYAPFSGHRSFSLFYSLFKSTFNCYRAIMLPTQNPQALPSFNVALHPDHYKTVLPNLSYPSRPSTHIPWSGSSAPLVFSVGQKKIRVLPQPYVSPPQNTTRPKLTVASPTVTPNLQVILFPRSKSDTDVNPSSISGSHSHS